MSRIDLETPFLDGGIDHVHFFNGRILSAQDLQDEQAANRRQYRRLGLAIGAGVVHGLGVTVVEAGGGATVPVLGVDKGLALNAQGHTLELTRGVEINLVQEEPPQVDQAGLFTVCLPPQPDVGPIGHGAYVLLMSPASDYRESAPLHGLDDEGRVKGCGSRYAREGVRFRLLRLPVAQLLTGLTGLSSADFNEPAAATGWWRLRSALAHLCLGSAELHQYPVSFPVTPPGEVVFGALNRLLSADSANGDDEGAPLTDCEVPLALFYWSGSGIRFVDDWAVRRRPIPPLPDPVWSTVFNSRFAPVAEAGVLQFQDQIAAMLHHSTLVNPTARVEDYFTHLPPVGYLPVGDGRFHWSTFLGAHAPPGETSLDEALVRTVVDAALLRAPLGVVARGGNQASQATRLKVYRINGRDGYVLFTRPGPAEVLAREVHFDDTVCQMDGVETVQGALEELCQRIHGCCTLVLRPGPGWEQPLTTLAPGQDVHICFQAGHFPLDQPLMLHDLGHVRVCGAGPGTRLTAPDSETVLGFEDCASVSVSHLQAGSGIALAPGAEAVRHLNGTLTFRDCPRVTVNHLTLSCATGNRRAASCLNVRNPAGQDSTVDIRDCQLSVGSRQTGILVIDTACCRITDNRIGPVTAGTPLGQGIVVGGTFTREATLSGNSVQEAVQGIHVGLSHRESSRGDPDRVELIRISGNTVNVRLGSGDNRERHALFAGNSDSLLVENNYATLTRGQGANQAIDGLRLYGHFGRRIIVRGNHFQGFTIGVLLNVLNPPPPNPALQWVIDDNLMASAAQAVSVIPTALRSRVRGIGNNYA